MGFGESGLKWLENELLFEENFRCFDPCLLHVEFEGYYVSK